MKEKVYVWDPLVRLFHWTLVLAFIIAYFTGDEESSLHVYAGYYILGLVALRIVWGVLGTRYARFSNIIYSPSAVVDYLKGFIGLGSGKRYLGHNPAGGWMVIALLISLLLTGVSGLQVYGLEGQGPLAQNVTTPYSLPAPEFVAVSGYEKEDHRDDEHEQEEHEDDEAEELWEEVHEFFANFTVLLIFLHIGGVFASSLKDRRNLVKSMLNGYKQQ